ncbi:MAG: nucleoid occlusion protein [Ruminococcaceae bacterium]|nr:nucleoid occlusion protein [Oscillospiraceae bacterium]
MMDMLSMIKEQCVSKDNVLQISVDKILPNPFQPRKSFDGIALEEMSRSIKQYGVLQPITVRKISPTLYELIAGERRLRACKFAGLTKIPAIVVEMNDCDSAGAALVENLQREDLSFMEEAEAYNSLMALHGFTQEQIALRLGKSQSNIANKLRLLRLSDKVKRIVAENNLTERHARALLKLPDEGKQLEALKKVCDSSCNVSETEKIVENLLKEKTEKSPKRTAMLKDVRIFMNTINRAVSVMIESGINAESKQTEFEGYYEYVIKIPKNMM